MPVLNDDKFLVNIDGDSYQATVGDSARNDQVPGDAIVLVNRKVNNVWQSFKLPVSRLRSANFDDNDLFLISRNGVSYKATGSEIKAKLIVRIESATIEKINCGNNATCFNVTLTSPNPFPENVTVSGIPRVFSLNSSKVFWPGSISATSQGFQINSVVTPDSFTPVLLGNPGSFSSDRKTLIIRMQYPVNVTYNGSTQSCRTLFGTGSVGCSLTFVTSNGQESNKLTASTIPIDVNDWSNG